MIIQNKSKQFTAFNVKETETAYSCEFCAVGIGLGGVTKVTEAGRDKWVLVNLPKELQGLDIPSYALGVVLTKV